MPPAHVERIDRREDRRHEGRPHRRRTPTLRYQGGAFPRIASGIRRDECVCHITSITRTIAYDVVANRPSSGRLPGPGRADGQFCRRKRHRGTGPKALNMEPIDFRIKNAAREGASPPTARPTARSALAPPWRRRRITRISRRHWARTRGAAWRRAFGSTSGAVLRQPQHSGRRHGDAFGGSPDIGGSRASMCMMTAEELGIPYEQVARSSPTPVRWATTMTDGSRTTFATGMAASWPPATRIKALRPRRQTWGSGRRRRWEKGHARPGWRQCRKFPAAVAEGDRRRPWGPPAVRSPGTTNTMRTGAGSASATHICDAEVDPKPAPRRSSATRCASGCRQGGPSQLRRRAVPGRRPGHRLGAQRGSISTAAGTGACRTPASSTIGSGLLGSADDRYGDPGDP